MERGQKRVLSRSYFQKAYKGRAVAVLLHTPVLCALPLPPRMSLTLISEKLFFRNSLYQSSCDGRNRAHSYNALCRQVFVSLYACAVDVRRDGENELCSRPQNDQHPPPPPPPASPRDETMSNLSLPFGTKQKKTSTALSIMYKCSLPPLKKVQPERKMNFH